MTSEPELPPSRSFRDRFIPAIAAAVESVVPIDDSDVLDSDLTSITCDVLGVCCSPSFCAELGALAAWLLCSRSRTILAPSNSLFPTSLLFFVGFFSLIADTIPSKISKYGSPIMGAPPRWGIFPVVKKLC